MDYVGIYFQDDAPAFGCGYHRVLTVANEGDPARLFLLEPASCAHEIVTRERFASLMHGMSRHHVYPFEAEDMIERLIKNAASYGRYTPVVRAALLELGCSQRQLPEDLANVGVTASPIVRLDGEAPDPSTSPLPGEGSGKFMQRLWMAGHNDPDALVAIVLANWPGRKTKRSDVFYNYNLLVKNGVANVPPWPAKK